MELKDNYAIVMKSDSSMVKVKLKDNMSVGDVLVFLEDDIYVSSVNKGIKNKMFVTILSIAAALALVILPVINTVNSRDYALVSLDINPSIQFKLDKNQKIVSARAFNQDGIELDLQGLKGLNLEDGLTILNEKLQANGYTIKDDKIIVGFAFLSKKEDIAYEKEVKNKVDKSFKNSKIIYLKGNKKDSKAAEERGISLGRYEAILKIDDDDLEKKIDNMSVEEILGLLNNKSIKLDKDLREELEDALDDKTDNELDEDDLDNNIEDTDDNDEVETNSIQKKEYNNNSQNNNDNSDDNYDDNDHDDDDDDDNDDNGNNDDD